MGVAEVKKHLLEYDPNLVVLEFSQSSATVDLAAEVLGVDPDQIAKTMAFHLKDEDILVVLAGKAKVNNRKFKDVFGCKAKMIKPEELVEITGHPMGGVCPFGLIRDLRIFMDHSLAKYDIVYPAAGARNAAIEMSVAQLAEITGAVWIDVSDG